MPALDHPHAVVRARRALSASRLLRPGTALRLRRAGIARVLVTGGSARVALRGEITGREADELAAHLRGLVRNGCRHLVVDLTEVTYLARESAGVFFGTLRTLKDVEGSMVLQGACPRSTATLRCLGLGRLTEVCGAAQ
ncbi:STAS domain-containing protein [Streptomyces sp. G44]|uniref:STAS domain-containing protein n=1 Tax=Streptomyces sp. G44 TaxID=2807632 RepID=UPI00195F8DED|nr:STAS domain-containing protein [Streptomyces sp. G44]MBM7171448.1 STAS domain-containing protein [Streptomyces sp. G44]